MPWNSYNHVMEGPVGLADIATALGMADPADWDNAIIDPNNTLLNPMAKYKPIKGTINNVALGPGFITNEQRSKLWWGFAATNGSNPPKTLLKTNESLSTLSVIPKNDWVYQRPTSSDWKRPLDFQKVASNVPSTTKGYDGYARAPLAIDVGTLNKDDKSIIILFADGVTDAVPHPLGYQWHSDRSLSLSELIGGYNQSALGWLVSFVLINRDNSDNRNLIITNKTLSQFATNGVFQFEFYAEGNGSPSEATYCPPVPILQNNCDNGDEFLVIVCLANTTVNWTGMYSVKSTTSDLNTFGANLYSLGFVDGCDRTTTQVVTGTMTLDSMTISDIRFHFTNMDTEVTYQGLTWKKYLLSVDAIFDTTGIVWGGGFEKLISGDMVLKIANSGYGMFAETPSTSGLQNLSVDIGAYVASDSANRRTIFTSSNDRFLWLVKSGSSTLYSNTISIDSTDPLTIDYPVNTPITATASSATPTTIVTE